MHRCFKGLVSVRLCPCVCTPLPVNLVACGLFPCTPIRPSIAVDISFLQFVREVFLRFAPNTTAMSEALEAFLNLRRYKPQTKVSLRAFIGSLRLTITQGSLRRRFGKALQWYSVLSNASTTSIQQRLEDARKKARNSIGKSAETRPSEYLRARCPLCFGGSLQRDVNSKYVPPLSTQLFILTSVPGSMSSFVLMPVSHKSAARSRRVRPIKTIHIAIPIHSSSRRRRSMRWRNT